MPDRAPLTDAAIADALDGLRGWTYDAGRRRLVRALAFDDFRAAFAFLLRVAFEAEAMDHHPEIENVYNRVTLALATHDAGDRVTETDVALARRIDRLAPPEAPTAA